VEVLGSSVSEGRCRSCGCLRKRIGSKNPKWTGYGEISGERWADIQAKAKAGTQGYARRKNIAFSLTIKQAWNLFLKQGRKCALSGIDLSFERANPTASLDRIDSTEGYVLSNVQWIHKDLNLMKQSLAQATFIEWCHKVANHQGG